MINRRDVYRLGTFVLGGAMGLALAVPGVRYILSPLGRRARSGGLQPLTRLSQLRVGVPEAFPILDERQDAWVRYPREPVGSIWLVRQPEGAEPKVVAFTAECPHLGCAVNLSADRTKFRCPCHDSTFDFAGKPQNAVPPRPMDRLEVELSEEVDPAIRVRFRRFLAQKEEPIPLA